MTDTPRTKITYATLRADNEDLHAAFEAGVTAARARLGQTHANIIAGAEREGEGEFELRSPIDQDILVGRFVRASRADVRDAIAAARAAQPAWAAGAGVGHERARRHVDNRQPQFDVDELGYLGIDAAGRGLRILLDARARSGHHGSGGSDHSIVVGGLAPAAFSRLVPIARTEAVGGRDEPRPEASGTNGANGANGTQGEPTWVTMTAKPPSRCSIESVPS